MGLIIKAGNTPPAQTPSDNSASQAGDQYLVCSADYAGALTLRPKLSVSFVAAGAGSPTATPTIVYGSPTAAAFQQLVSPPGYTGHTDTFISDYGDPDTNYGADPVLRLRSNDHRASLLRFDLAAIPAYARVYSATISIYAQSRTNINPLAVSAHRLLQPWSDLQATWILAASGQRWAFPGANGLGTDRVAEAFATSFLTTTHAWTAWDVTALAQEWIANPLSNNGVILKAGSGGQVEYTMASGQYLPEPGLRPRLDIVYALPEGPTATATPTPEATSTATVTPTPSVTLTVIVFQFGQRPDADYTGVQDTYLNSEGNPAATNGLDSVLTVGANDSQAALLRFDLTGIPGWATVHSASLSLFVDGAAIGYPITTSTFSLLRPWSETEATWTRASPGTSWAVPGANGEGTDRSAAAVSTGQVSALSVWFDVDVTAMAAAWVLDPETNHGLVLKGQAGPQTSYDFISSQFQISQGGLLRPKLTVAYSLPEGPTPTPTNTRTATATPTRVNKYLPVVLNGYAFAPSETATATPTSVR